MSERQFDLVTGDWNQTTILTIRINQNVISLEMGPDDIE
jgi:hypothetical protein